MHDQPAPMRQPGQWTRVPRGPVLAYRPGDASPCPGCGQRQWHVGRASAECATCGTALPLDLNGRTLAAARLAGPATDSRLRDRIGAWVERALPWGRASTG